MLTDRITLAPTAELEPEDYFSSALGVIFPDDITNQHGDSSTPVIYTSPTYGKIFLNLADPVREESRKLFAQYLWNAGVYMAVALEDAAEGTVHGERHAGQEENNTARDKRKEADRDEPHYSAEPSLDTRNDTIPTSSALEAPIPLTSPHQPFKSTTTTTTSHKQKPPWDVRNESVLELGAGTGLAGITAAKAGARQVLLTDYPAPEVLANLAANVERNLSADERGGCRVAGHEWGVVPDSGEGHENHQRFTRVLVADCLWMPAQHGNLHRSIAYYLSPSSPPPFSPSSSSSSFLTTSPSSTTHTHKDTPTNANTTSGGRALVVAGFHTGRAKMAPFFDERALAAAGLCLESIVERDAVGRERPWMWSRTGGGDGGGGGGEGEEENKETGDGEGRAGISENKRWLVVAVLKKL